MFNSSIDEGDISYMDKLKTFINFQDENIFRYILPRSIEKLVIYYHDPLLFTYKNLTKLEININLTILDYFHLKSFKWCPTQVVKISQLKHYTLEKLSITNVEIDIVECVNIKKINTTHLEKLSIFINIFLLQLPISETIKRHIKKYLYNNITINFLKIVICTQLSNYTKDKNTIKLIIKNFSNIKKIRFIKL